MIGRTVSHYKIVEELGGGAMGIVYKAEDLRLKCTRALKFLPPELTRDEGSKTRFVREAQAAADLDHGNICSVHEIDETPEGQLFICMSFYEGETLKKKLSRGRLPAHEALRIASEIARGLGEAHRHGIVHRDIKPANIMITTQGEVKIVDFGIAKLAGRTKVTESGKSPGTLSYMSPEQLTGSELDGRSDLFSLGVVLYEMVAGRLPFDAHHEAAVMYSIVNRQPAPVRDFCRKVPKGLQEILDKALAKDAKSRFENADEFYNDLLRVRIGKGRRHRLRRSIKFAAPALAAAALVLLVADPNIRRDIRRWIPLGGPVADKHIAVLPFENVGGVPENQAFCDGLVETLTGKLSQLEQFHEALWVVPASEVRERGVTGPGEAGREFAVNLVITGSLQRLGDNFRLVLNLIEVYEKRSRQVASTLVTDHTTNILLLQDETVIKVAGMINVEMGQQTRRVLFAGGTAVASAYDHYLQGRGYAQRYEKVENLDRAIQLFQQAIEEDPAYALAYAGLGEAFWRKYRATMETHWIDMAIENCERAYDLNNLLAPVRVTLGLIYQAKGENEKAISEFERALALDASNAAAYGGLAAAYVALNELDDAEATYKKAVEMKPDVWAGYYDLGIFYYKHGRYDEAVGQLKKVIKLTPDNVWGYNTLGAVYYRQERWPEAREMFSRSIEVSPDYRAYSNLGTVEYIEGRYDRATAMFEKALEINDASYITWGNLGNAHYLSSQPGSREKAREVYAHAARLAEKQLEVNPRDAGVLSSLAGFYVMIDEGEKARQAVERALAIAPNDVWVMYTYGYTWEQLGDRAKALEWIRRALEAGYPMKEIERDPFLRDLRADARFADMLQGSKQ